MFSHKKGAQDRLLNKKANQNITHIYNVNIFMRKT